MSFLHSKLLAGMTSTTAQTAAEHAFGTNAKSETTTTSATATPPDENMPIEEQMGPVLPPGWTKPVPSDASIEFRPGRAVIEPVSTAQHETPVPPPNWTKPNGTSTEMIPEPATATQVLSMPPSPPSTAPEQIAIKKADEPPSLPARNLPVLKDDPFVTASADTTAPGETPSTPSVENKQEPGIWAAPPPNPNERKTNIDVPYVRDPSRLVAYLIPYPEPQLPNGKGTETPQRFFIYTPPLPPLNAPNGGLPKEGAETAEATQTRTSRVKNSKKRAAYWWKGDGKGNEESKPHRVQRWWQGNVRKAKENPAPIKTFKGVRGRAEIGIQKAMDWTKSSNVEFLLRVPSDKPDKDAEPRHWGLEEIVLVYPPEMRGTPDEIRAEFLRTLLATKSKAYVESVIATGLFPVGLIIDTLCALFWPFGGLAEIAAVWAIASVRSAHTARRLLKLIDHTGLDPNAKLKLTFVPSATALPISHYLEAECHAQDMLHFNKAAMTKPAEAEVLNAIGWQPSRVNGTAKNFQDEQWEARVAKEDLQMVVRKGVKEYRKFVKKSAKKVGKKSRGKQGVRFWKRRDQKLEEKKE